MKAQVLAAIAGGISAVVLAFPAAASSSGATYGPSANWPQYGASAARQFYQPGETILGRGNVAKLKESLLTVWGGNSDPPVLDDGVLYESACVYQEQTGLYNCMIAAQKAAGGGVLWKHTIVRQAAAPEVGSLSVSNSQVIVPFIGSKLEAVDTATGQSIRWQVALPLAAVPAVAGGTVFAAASNGKLYAFSQATGAQLWAVQLGSSIGQPPTVSGGIVYAGSGDGTLHALNAATGAQLWSAKLAGPLTAYPSAGDGMVFAATSNGSTGSAFYALNATSGALRWKFAGSSKSQLQWAAVDPGNVYVVDNVPGTVYALAASTGAKLWSVTPTGGGAGPAYEPVVANGVIYVGTNYSIDAYNTATGASLASLSLDTPGIDCAFPQFSTGLAVANGVLYSGCEAWALPASR